MDYIGSKTKLLSFIENGVKKSLLINKDGRKSCEMVFADLFAGTGVVGEYFKLKGFNVISNDMQYYSYVVNKNLIENINPLGFPFKSKESLEEILNELNNLPSNKIKKGFIYQNYCLGGTKGKEFERLYFSDENAILIDSVRQEIENKKSNNQIDENQYFYLLSCLLKASDKVSNTTGVYGAFLKTLNKNALKKMVLEPLKINDYTWMNDKKSDDFLNLKGSELYALYQRNNLKYQVYNENISQLIEKIEGDVLYLDPPYNNRHYCDNYHILETIAKYDNPEIKGKTGLRVDNMEFKSDFSKKSKAKQAIQDIIEKARFKYVFLSYSSESIVSKQDIENMMNKLGKVFVLEKSHKRFKSSLVGDQTKREIVEYLFCLIKH